MDFPSLRLARMALLVVGIALVALGLLSGSMLVAFPLGFTSTEPGATLWVLFPVFSLVGVALAVIGGNAASLRWLARIVSLLLLALALAAAAVLVLAAGALLPPINETGALWYVLAVAGVLGIGGAAVLERVPPATPTGA